MKRGLAVVVAIVCGIYIFIPEPTDVIPVLGWLDEGLALALLGWSLKTLGVSPASILSRKAEAKLAAKVKSTA